MGRNPVVGRQGPAHHAAVIPGDDVKRLKIKQIRSGIGHSESMNRTLKSIGLRHYQMTIEAENSASLRGMLFKVRHLVEVTPVGEN